MSQLVPLAGWLVLALVGLRLRARGSGISRRTACSLALVTGGVKSSDRNTRTAKF